MVHVGEEAASWHRVLFARLERQAEQRWVVVALVTLAAALRALWCIVRPPGVTGEAFNVATTLARTGQFADAFAAGTGPTAHLPPIGPAVAALAYVIFGIDTPAANFALSIYAIILVTASYLLGNSLFKAIGAPALARVIALLLLAILPVYFGVETVENRVWETGVTVVAYLGFLLLLVKVEERSSITRKAGIFLIVLAALLFFANPIIGISAYIVGAAYALRRLSLVKNATIGLAAASTLIAVLTPWAVRNYTAMHAVIPLRSNAGLELALANFPAAVHADDQAAAFLTRFGEIHPGSQTGRAKMQRAGGEVAYSARLKAKTLTWITGHPADYARLAVSHFFQFVLPRPWHFTFSTTQTPESRLRAGAASSIGLLSLVAVLFTLWRGPWTARYVAMATILPALGYMSFQPSLRYEYLVYCLSAFFASWLVVGLFRTGYIRAGMRDSRRGPVHV